MAMWKYFDRFMKILAHCTMVLSGLCLAITILLVTLEIFLRKLFGLTTYIAEEFSGYLLVAILFFGITYTQSENALIKVDIVTNKLSNRINNIIIIPIYLLSIWCLVLLGKYSLNLVIWNYRSGIMSLSAFPIPLYLPQSVIVFGITCLLLQMIKELIEGVYTVITKRNGRKL